MKPRWDYGEPVRLIRNVRNDGTYPGLATGAPLVRRGSVGHVIDVGTFLQDQVIYSVNFLSEGRIVGCREEELIGADEEWFPSRYEFRDRVKTRAALGIGGEVLVDAGAEGEVIKVLRSAPDRIAYHIHFECLAGRVLEIPEEILDSLAPTGGDYASLS